mmetsp:Transcript_35361/g.56710  ORF Transcript_35361/g.56710 Transcript_35361/m.56710 type:complete len:100 (-) Transcript_35361:53-352(-)
MMVHTNSKMPNTIKGLLHWLPPETTPTTPKINAARLMSTEVIKQPLNGLSHREPKRSQHCAKPSQHEVRHFEKQSQHDPMHLQQPSQHFPNALHGSTKQ